MLKQAVSRRALGITLTIMAWWWLMMAVHEFGHVLGCFVSGATIEYVTLWPWTISQTMRSGSHSPLVDTWAGPLVGMVAPLMIWICCRRFKVGDWIGGWTGFCLIVNGVYLAAGWIESAGDAADLVHLGMPVWLLIVVGSVAGGLGLWCWHIILDRRRGGPTETEA